MGVADGVPLPEPDCATDALPVPLALASGVPVADWGDGDPEALLGVTVGLTVRVHEPVCDTAEAPEPPPLLLELGVDGGVPEEVPVALAVAEPERVAVPELSPLVVAAPEGVPEKVGGSVAAGLLVKVGAVGEPAAVAAPEGSAGAEALAERDDREVMLRVLLPLLVAVAVALAVALPDAAVDALLVLVSDGTDVAEAGVKLTGVAEAESV